AKVFAYSMTLRLRFGPCVRGDLFSVQQLSTAMFIKEMVPPRFLKVTRTLSPSQCMEQTTIRSSKPDRVWTLSYPMEQRMKNTWVYSRRTCLLSSNVNLKSFSTLPVRIHSPETN